MNKCLIMEEKILPVCLRISFSWDCLTEHWICFSVKKHTLKTV